MVILFWRDFCIVKCVNNFKCHSFDGVTRMKKFSIAALGSAVLFSSNAFAIDLGDNITISDDNYQGSGWYSNREDQEVEPGMVTGQKWDQEGFFLNRGSLTMVSGFDFVNGESGSGRHFSAGDLFLDVNNDAVYGDIHRGSNGYETVKNSFGYDYVLDLDFSTLSYDVYAIDANTDVVTAFYKQNDGSSPFQFHAGAGDVALASGTIDLGTLTDAESGFQGGTHYFASLDISFLGDGTEFIAHNTMGCGNDNLMGQGTVEVPEPGILAMLGLGLAGIGFSRRKAKASA